MGGFRGRIVWFLISPFLFLRASRADSGFHEKVFCFLLLFLSFPAGSRFYISFLGE